MSDQKSNCLICGEDLKYETSNSKQKCFYCGNTFQSNAECSNGHFVCDYCHASSANQIIMKFCSQSTSTNPVELANDIMKHPSFSMHGPEHHYLVPAVLLTAYHNKVGTQNLIPAHLEEAMNRAKNVLGGFCGFYGTCGAAIGTGVYMSIITESTPLSVKGWQLSNTITAKSLTCIAESGGPRCCKRDTYIALQEANDFIEKNLNVSLDKSEEIICEYTNYNKQCKKMNCQFYRDPKEQKAEKEVS
jgi:hypothetical protein